MTGTFRFLPFGDFKAQFFHGVLLEIFLVVIPFLALIIVYGKERGGLFLLAIVGIIANVLSIILAVKHIHNAQND